MEFAAVFGSISLLDRAGLTIFQVQPLEPLMTLVGVAFMAGGAGGSAKRNNKTWALWLGAALGLWSVLAGILGIYTGLKNGLVQAQLQAVSTDVARFAFTLRLAVQTIVPAAAAAVIGLRAALRAALLRGRQPVA